MSSPGGALSDAGHRALLRYAVIVHRARAVSVIAVALVAGIVHCGGGTSLDPQPGTVADGGTDATGRGDVGDASASIDGSDDVDADEAGNGCPLELAPAGSACATEGKSCHYCHMEPGSASMLGFFCNDEVCDGGVWKIVRPTCACPTVPPTVHEFCYGTDIGCHCAYDGCGASRRTFTCAIPGIPPASWIEDMPPVPCTDAGM